MDTADVHKDGPIKVAYLGPKASYTHQAALQHFPPSTRAVLTPVPSIASVFTSVRDQSSTYGVVPFENSSNGAVLTTLDLFASLADTHPTKTETTTSPTIVAEEFVPVHHSLLGRLPRTTTSNATTNTTDHLTTLLTHPQAWGQCETYLTATLPHLERIDTPSTSAAAARVAALAAASPDGSNTTTTTTAAAIASPLAAEAYGLDVLKAGIEDRAGNATRFFVLASGEGGHGGGGGGGEKEEQEDGRARGWKTLLHFRVSAQEDPGALAAALAVFGRWGLSLTSMYTRPDPEADRPDHGRGGPDGRPGGEGERAVVEGVGDGVAETKTTSTTGRWRYIFFVEFANAAEQEDLATEALRELEGVTRRLAVAGRWRSG